MEFKVGDRVECAGIYGVVSIDLGTLTYPIKVKWDGSQNEVLFTRDGRFMSFFKEPSLKLIERPKSRKKIKMCAFVWKDSAVSYQSASDVQEGSTDYKNRLVNNKFFRVESKDYEIEVEE